VHDKSALIDTRVTPLSAEPAAPGELAEENGSRTGLDADHMARSMSNVLYYGDNLDILRRYIKDESVDLVYLDPPFNSNADYNVLSAERDGTRAHAQIKAFGDTWVWDREAARNLEDAVQNGGPHVASAMMAFRTFLGTSDMLAYLSMMAPRLVELRRVLNPMGSIYLHCDPTASHYLKVLMDAVFRPENFRNEIIWRRTGAHGPRRCFGPIHDTLLFYSKSSSYFFEVVRRPYMRGHVAGRYAADATGGLKFISGGNVLTGAGTTGGQSGMLWRGFDPSKKNRHWAIPGFLAKQMPPEFAKLGVLAKLESLYEAGLVEIRKGTEWPTPVRYLGDNDGSPMQDLWAYQPYTEETVQGTDVGIDADVAWMGPTDPERLGYPTQKPQGLLERIIRSSCPENGIVLDPFCGCGTAIAAAQSLKRRWIGIDITYLAINLIKNRLRDAFGARLRYRVVGEPVSVPDASELARNDPYQFQWWALGLIGARPVEEQKGADKGIDGRLYFHDSADVSDVKQVVVSVKAGQNIGVAMVRDVIGVIQRERADMGVFTTMEEPTRAMRKEAANAGFYASPAGTKHSRVQLLTVDDLLAGKKIDMPGWHEPRTFKKARRNRSGKAHNPTLPFEESSE